jgi:hypothetical protein
MLTFLVNNSFFFKKRQDNPVNLRKKKGHLIGKSESWVLLGYW